MFLYLLFLVALLQFGESQDQCVREIRLLKQDIQTTVRNTITAESVTREDVQELVEDKASEVVQALNRSVTTGNQEVVDILSDTKSLVEATRTVVEQEQCVTREEVSAMFQNEIQTLLNYAEEQRNSTALLLEAIKPGTLLNPAPSCKNILSESPSGYYWIQPNSGPPVQQYCDMTRTFGNSTGGWMRVANLDMTDPNQQCPSGFNLVTSPKRTCGRPGSGCVSTTFPVHGVEYSKVCGRVIGYQVGLTFAFYGGQPNIDSRYVHGVSLTHGAPPRAHIWTFASGIDEVGNLGGICPCSRTDLTYTPVYPPPFVGEDYFCETGSRDNIQRYRFYSEDPLWDGQGCGEQSTCCSFNNPPWFCKQLPQPTSEDIELRMCGNRVPSDNDTPLEIVEIYVQ